MMMRTLIAAVLVAVVGGAAVAAVPVPTVPGTVYVPSQGNTTSLADPYIGVGGSFPTDNLWYHPWDTASFASSAGEATGGISTSTEDAPMITTTVPMTVVPTGSYDVYLYYINPGWGDATLPDGVVANLNGGGWQTITAANSTELTDQLSDGDRPMYEAHLGQVSGASSIAVDIDDDPTQVGWCSYLGLGVDYLAVAPRGMVVNATELNTTSAIDPDPWFTVPPDYLQDDNLWTLWGGDTWLAYGGLSGQFGAGEDAPMLTTSASGLDPARTYDVFVLLLGDGPTNGIQAAVSGGSLQTYMLDDATETTLFAHGGTDRPVYEAKIGQVSGVSDLAIDIDDDQANFFSCIYYGLAYEDIGPAETVRTWATDALGDWGDWNNWAEGGVPNSNTQMAIFGDVITAPRTVINDAAVTVKSVRFDNANSYAIVGHGSVTLEADSGNASITVLQGDHQLQVEVNLNSDTDVDVAASSSLAFNNALDLGGNTLTKTGDGTMAINNELATGGGSVVGLAGTITGGGTIAGDLINVSAAIAPGNSPGTLTIDGDFSQSAGGVLMIELAGTGDGEFDVLEILGGAVLGGSLEITALYTPDAGDSWVILTADDGIIGSFDAVTPGYEVSLASGATELVLTANVPEPASALLLLAAWVGVIRKRR